MCKNECKIPRGQTIQKCYIEVIFVLMADVQVTLFGWILQFLLHQRSQVMITRILKPARVKGAGR